MSGDGLTWKERATTFTAPEQRTSLEPWMAIGITMQYLYKLSWEEVCKRIRGGKGADTLRKTVRSPAGKSLRNYLTEHYSDPTTLSKTVIQAGALDFTADFLAALEWAKEAHDYNAVYKMTKDLLAISGVKEEPPKTSPAVLHLHLSRDSLEAIAAETSYESIDAEIVEPLALPAKLP